MIRKTIASLSALLVLLLVSSGLSQQTPPEVVPNVNISVTVAETDQAHWILPGPRELEAAIFGTPERPLGFEDDVGVPLDARLTSDDGSAYTTTAGPTPHSDRSAPIRASLQMSLDDITAVDSPDSRDQVEFEAEFTDPNDATYRVVVDRVVPRGPDHTFFGGVVTNAYLHGQTGIGTKLQPLQFVYGGFWGVGTLYKNGERIGENRLVHVMLSQRVRTAQSEGYELVTSDAVDSLQGKQIHVILPPVVVTPDGPQSEPVPNGFELPNGAAQPFIHVMYDDVGVVAGSSF